MTAEQLADLFDDQDDDMLVDASNPAGPGGDGNDDDDYDAEEIARLKRKALALTDENSRGNHISLLLCIARHK